MCSCSDIISNRCLVKCGVILAVIALRGEVCRSYSLPENKLVSSTPQQQQPSSSASSSLIASIEEKCLRGSLDSLTSPPCTVDRMPSSADVKPAPCDVVVTSRDVTSPIRSVRPARLDLSACQPSKVDSSPDDRKPLVGILLTRSPRRNSLLGFVVM